jgi:hypothetical protein
MAGSQFWLLYRRDALPTRANWGLRGVNRTPPPLDQSKGALGMSFRDSARFFPKWGNGEASRFRHQPRRPSMPREKFLDPRIDLGNAETFTQYGIKPTSKQPSYAANLHSPTCHEPDYYYDHSNNQNNVN